MTGIERIAIERKRQIDEEGWCSGHDDCFDESQLAIAAAIYAMPEDHRTIAHNRIPQYWPWDYVWWRPTPDNRIRELEKAGALIAAEIDRILRRQTEVSDESAVL